MIKIWHLVIVFCVAPYLFTYFTPEEHNMYGFINIMMCFCVCTGCAYLIFEPESLKKLNSELKS